MMLRSLYERIMWNGKCDSNALVEHTMPLLVEGDDVCR